ncbi:lysoplasmalogenase family protein [Candidatus Viadribacter manganicus]|uniref:Lysoplasmalogenase n=1 Tax=Candidatus Viadribacter manganicus TaxID=1759059 RepID=A0A1B1AJ80_9PROT|nr:lysoplasmalogenase family protein [Candidatus Viadribacter manganicus]ANP46617.1 hypothetical protein ATE48_12160 [Candidatus Viadribacter manganicus]
MGTIAIGPVFWALSALAMAAAVAYGLYFLRQPHGFLRAIVKTTFMGAAAGALTSAGAPFPLIAAIFLSALGDFFLAFKSKWTLPLGILAFLLAQLTYVLMFGAVWFFSGDNSPLWPRYLAMAAIAALLITFLIWFWRTEAFKHARLSNTLAVTALVGLGLLLPVYVITGMMALNTDPESSPSPTAFVPLAAFALAAVGLAIWRRKLGATPLVAMIYAGAITAMAIAAMWLPWMGWPAMLGALSFLVSDLVLAAELFRLPADAPSRRLTAPIVWWTYVTAQTLIVTGVMCLVLAR